jgi:predicted nucleotidyltransferase
MRLTEFQRRLIKQTVAEIVGEDARVWLFGSRADDAQRGGDIDLLIETPRRLASKVSLLCRLEGALVMRLGDRKIDMLIKDARTPEAPIFRVAKQNGVLL